MGRAARDGNFVLTRLGTESLRTLRWRGLDSKFQFRPRVDEFRVGKSLPEERVDPVLLLEPLGARDARLGALAVYQDLERAALAVSCERVLELPLGAGDLPARNRSGEFVGGARWCRVAGDQGPGATTNCALTRDRTLIQGELCDPVPLSSIPLLSRRMRAFNGMPRLSSRQTSDESLGPKPLNRSSNPLPPAARRNGLRYDPLLCPDRVTRRPARPPKVARN